MKSVRIPSNYGPHFPNSDQNNSEYGHFFRRVENICENVSQGGNLV